MIIGKNDETKGFKVHLPKEKIVITTYHIRNADTSNSAQNTQLQNDIEHIDPMLRRAEMDRDETPKRKDPAELMKNGSTADENSVSRNNCIPNEGNEDDVESLPEDDGCKLRCRHAKWVPSTYRYIA